MDNPAAVWQLSDRADPEGRVIADRHYNRQHIGATQFVTPGRCLVLTIPAAALWITSWPFAEYVKHAWPGAMVCSAFRNERPDLYLSSDLVRDACAVTRWRWPDLPAAGLVTFVDPSRTRRKRDPGRCFRRAGFAPAGHTRGGLVALRLSPDAFPAPRRPLGTLFGGI